MVRPACQTPLVRQIAFLIFALLTLLATGCTTGGGDDDLLATTTPTLPTPPWRTEPAIAATGINEGILTAFITPDANRAGCRPLGIDTEIWNPPASIDRPGSTYITRWGERRPPTKPERIRRGDRSVTEWSDGSFSSNVALKDGTHRFDVEIPVSGAGTPGDWCTYVYGPTDPSETGDAIVRSLRFIEQPGETSGSS